MSRIASVTTHMISVPRPQPVWTAHEESKASEHGREERRQQSERPDDDEGWNDRHEPAGVSTGY